MNTLRAWRTETLWLLGLCTMFAVIGLATPASADSWRKYDEVRKWCYVYVDVDCLWQDND